MIIFRPLKSDRLRYLGGGPTDGAETYGAQTDARLDPKNFGRLNSLVSSEAHVHVSKSASFLQTAEQGDKPSAEEVLAKLGPILDHLSSVDPKMAAALGATVKQAEGLSATEKKSFLEVMGEAKKYSLAEDP